MYTKTMIELRPGNDISNHLLSFKKHHNIRFILGFSGGADDSNSFINFLENYVNKTQDSTDSNKYFREIKDMYLSSIVSQILSPIRGYRIGILTGGTIWGVPNIATKIAKDLGFPTIGVFPFTASFKKQDLGDDYLDLKICVWPFVGNSKWGDESPVFTEILDSVIVIGGGAGTMVEIAHILKRNEKLDLPIKYILPIFGTGGTADKIAFFPGKPDVMARCIPQQPITSGEEACAFLRQHVLLEDIFD